MLKSTSKGRMLRNHTMVRLFSGVAARLADVRTIWWFGCHNFEEAPVIQAVFPSLRTIVAIDPMISDRRLARVRKVLGRRSVIALRKLVTSREHHEACGGRARFNLTSNDGASSSMLPLGRVHMDHFPKVKETGQLEAETIHLGVIPGPVADVLITDIQGSEYDVFKGNLDVVERIRFVYSEVCFDYLYEGQGLFGDISDLLADRFRLVGMIPDHATFGNALWERKDG